MVEPGRTYLPAAGHHWSLPLYDPVVKLLGGDAARELLLDVVGLDPDPRALARARRKGQRAALSIQLDQGFSDELPYPECAFDRVFSSFMLHHLEAAEKETTLREVRRVLKPGARFHLLDFATPDSNSAGRLGRWLHSSHRLKDNSDEQILSLMRQAGLTDPKRIAGRALLVGHIAYYQASARASSPIAASGVR